jgi:hypothetical protein
MYYILNIDKLNLFATYGNLFIGNEETVKYNLDKTGFVVESKKEIEELKSYKHTKNETRLIMDSKEWQTIFNF